MKIIRYAILSIVAMIMATSALAQVDEKQEFVTLGLKADTLMYSLLYKGDVKGGLEACKEKIAYFQKGESWTNFLQALNDKAYLYHELDSLEQLKSSVFENFEYAERYLDKSNPEWIRAKEQINSYYYVIGDYKNTRDIINEIIPIKEENKANSRELSTSYFNLGTAYNRLRDTENALDAFKKSIKVRYGGKKLGWGAGEKLNNIARVYKSVGELDSALHYLEVSESLFDTLDLNGAFKRFKRWKVEGYTLLAETWLEKKEFDKTKHYLDLIKGIKLTNKERVKWNENLSEYYYQIGDLDKAEETILLADQLAKETGARYTPPLKARRIMKIANMAQERGDLDDGLVRLQEGINILSPSFENKGIGATPKATQFFAKPDALKLLRAKGAMLKKKYEQSSELRDLTQSYLTYLIACNVIKEVRQGIRSTDSRNDLSGNAIEVYEEAIAVAYELYRTTGESKYVSMAFQLAESNKAQLLLENLNEQEARGYAGIPDTLATKVNDLRLYLSTLEDRMVRSGDVNKYEDMIYETKRELAKYNSILEKSFPRYFRLKYNNEAIDPALVQSTLLDTDQVLVEYFVGLKKIYLFIISKDEISMVEMNNEPIRFETVNSLLNIINTRPGEKAAEQELNDFITASKSAFDLFMGPVIDQISKSTRSIIIIPDDYINSIPFDVLLKSDPVQNNGFGLEAQNYLFEDFDINYNYSATLLQKIMSKEPADFSSNFVGYAPSFGNGGGQESRVSEYSLLNPLKCSKEEVQSISNLIGGAKRIGKNANKERFLQEAKDYKVLHLATHAYADPNDSKLNKIFLHDDFLSDVNIYNLELNTELAVLSACNTGRGTLLKGEGVMNLARGFMNAGCSSTLMSMWSVDDCTTSELMRLFYGGLEAGLKKDEALRQAKISYLENANKTKMHPYYWAAFVPFGDMSPVELEEKWYLNPALSIGVVLVIFLLLMFFFRKK